MPYILTRCGYCNSVIYATGGCCGDDSRVLTYTCSCGEKYIEELNDVS